MKELKVTYQDKVLGTVDSDHINTPPRTWYKVVTYYTREMILAQYWDDWKEEMIKIFGEGHPAITEEKFIAGWVFNTKAEEV